MRKLNSNIANHKQRLLAGNVDIRFSPGLNCIIGARGTCKSTVVESIRFGFNVGLDRVRAIIAEKSGSEKTGIVRETLGSGSVRCGFSVIEDGIATEVSVEREIGDAPRVLRSGKRDMIYADVLEEMKFFPRATFSVSLQRMSPNFVCNWLIGQTLPAPTS